MTRPRRIAGPVRRDPDRAAGRVRWWRWLALAASVVTLTSSVPAVPEPATGAFLVLQMNLCNSGLAVHSCYTRGRSVDEAVARIRRYRPDLVTLQEICRSDLYAGAGYGALALAMAAQRPGPPVSIDFVPAFNRDTGGFYRCTNGALFGVALVHRGNGRDVHYGWYRSQDASEEVRAWTCATVIRDRLTGCTTHLSTDPAVAIRQCAELMSILASPWVLGEVIVAGDVNLTVRAGRYDVRQCPPAGYGLRGDGALQQVLFSANLHWAGGGYEPMRWTDHPLLYQRFRL